MKRLNLKKVINITFASKHLNSCSYSIRKKELSQRQILLENCYIVELTPAGEGMLPSITTMSITSNIRSTAIYLSYSQNIHFAALTTIEKSHTLCRSWPFYWVNTEKKKKKRRIIPEAVILLVQDEILLY